MLDLISAQNEGEANRDQLTAQNSHGNVVLTVLKLLYDFH